MFETERAIHDKMEAAAQQETRGKVGCATDDPGQPAFRDRLQNRLRRARREAQKGSSIDELLYLLDKNPETARILELIELVGQ